MTPTKDFGDYLRALATRTLKPIDDLNVALERRNIPRIDTEMFKNRLQRQIETAQKQFTICFYGSFNSGKSTIINAILGLKGESRLSSEDSPDTAKSIRIQIKENPDLPDVRISLKGGQNKDMSWAEAKKYTSQVLINRSRSDNALAEAVEEVNYFLPNNPILNLCDVIDLPGTGSAAGDEHDAIANERIKESELIFWIIPTSRHEIDINEIRNLKSIQAINAQVIPVINVWQDKAVNIRSSMVQIDELKANIKYHYQQVFNELPNIKVIYGKEAERAIAESRTPDTETGYDDFIDFLQNDFLNNHMLQRTERIKRISNVMTEQAETLLQQSEITGITIDKAIEAINKLSDQEIADYQEIKNISEDCRTQLEPTARTASDKIIQIFKEKAGQFIRAKTTGFNLQLLERMINKDEVEEKMKKEFQTKYLEIGVPDSPISELVNDFGKSASRQIKMRWARHIEVISENAQSKPELGNRINDFIIHVSKDLTAIAGNQSFDMAIGIVIIVGGPVGVVAALLGLLAKKIFGKNSEDVLRKCELDTNTSIDHYKLSVTNNLMSKAEEMNNQIEARFLEEWTQRKDSRNIDFTALNALKNQLDNIKGSLDRFKLELLNWSKIEINS